MQASQAAESESSFSIIENILQNLSQSMINNDQNVNSQNNNDNTSLLTDMNPVI